MTTRERAYVALGSNLGDRAAHLQQARERLAGLPGTRLAATSTVEETAPLGPVTQGPFLNQMVLLDTELSPEELLEHCRRIEREQGRVRHERWGPRTIDLDIVRFGDRRVATPALVLPHPELPRRDFWARELAELDALVAARA